MQFTISSLKNPAAALHFEIDEYPTGFGWVASETPGFEELIQPDSTFETPLEAQQDAIRFFLKPEEEDEVCEPCHKDMPHFHERRGE